MNRKTLIEWGKANGFLLWAPKIPVLKEAVAEGLPCLFDFLFQVSCPLTARLLKAKQELRRNELRNQLIAYEGLLLPS